MLSTSLPQEHSSPEAQHHVCGIPLTSQEVVLQGAFPYKFSMREEEVIPYGLGLLVPPSALQQFGGFSPFIHRAHRSPPPPPAQIVMHERTMVVCLIGTHPQCPACQDLEVRRCSRAEGRPHLPLRRGFHSEHERWQPAALGRQAGAQFL